MAKTKNGDNINQRQRKRLHTEGDGKGGNRGNERIDSFWGIHVLSI